MLGVAAYGLSSLRTGTTNDRVLRDMSNDPISTATEGRHMFYTLIFAALAIIVILVVLVQRSRRH